MFKSNSLSKYEKLVVFSGVDRTRRELVELIYINNLEKRVRRCTILRGVALMYGIDGGTDGVGFCGYLVFWQ